MNSRRPALWAILVLMLMILGSACGQTEPTQSVEKVDKLVLVGPPGPVSIPLAYMVVNDKLADVAEEVELIVFENPDQLAAFIANESADFITMPSNSAAIFYNRGFDLQLIDISSWNALFGVSTDPSISSLADAAQQDIVVPFQGGMPDLLFQYIARSQDLDPLSDFNVTYTPNPQQGTQLLLSGQADVAILAEPLASIAIMQSQASEAPLQRAFAIGTEWENATDGELRTPMVGTVALPRVQERPEVIAAFMEEYRLAVDWMLENPLETGQMAEENLPELGFVAGPVAQPLPNITWDYVSAAEVRPEIEAFFEELTTLSPDVVGGKLPDDGFYYTPEP
ncbi:MAG: ABC transporter substrate-binding protein [Chloroflexota bacterium]